MEWSTIGLLVYLSLSVTLLIIISIHLFFSKQLKSVVRYNDKVILFDETEGIVKYVGEAVGKKGDVLYGIEVTKGNGDNGDQTENMIYFKTKNKENTAKFVKSKQIAQIIKTKQSLEFSVGDAVFVESKCIGIIRYVGIPATDDKDDKLTKVMYGIQLNELKGDSDGKYENIQYFSCTPNQGIYVQQNELKQTKETLAINEENKYESLKFLKFINELWSLRSIYGAVLVHLYDTSTDIGVCIQFGSLALAEESGKKDYKSINMLSFFIWSILFMLFYRIVAGLYYNHFFKTKVGKRIYSYFDLFLVVTDFYIIKLVHESSKVYYKSPSVFHKMLNLFESLFEAMPQLILQFAFVIRSINEPDLEEVPLLLIFISLLASIASITNKFMYDDARSVSDRAETLHCSMSKFPCLSFSYLLRLLWRFTELIVRFIIFTLLFVVLGGLYLGIYCIISLSVYLFLSKSGTARVVAKGVTRTFTVIFTVQALVGVPLRKEKKLAMIRVIDNAFSLAVITVFAVVQFECFMCTEWDQRAMDKNIYVEYCIYAAWIALFVEFVSYMFLLSMHMLCGDDIVQEKRKQVDKYTLHPGITNYFKVKRQNKIPKQKQTELEISPNQNAVDEKDLNENSDNINIIEEFRVRMDSRAFDDRKLDQFVRRADSESSGLQEFAFRAFTFCDVGDAHLDQFVDRVDSMNQMQMTTL